MKPCPDRSRAAAPSGLRWLLLPWLALAWTGCALEAGQPWGEVHFEVAARLDAASRQDEAGRVRTSKDYLVEVEALAVTFNAVTLTLRPEGTSAAFDPASPPPGFSLCHNGHCHADSGALVSYEEVALAVSGQQGVAGQVTQDASATVSLSEVPTPVPLTSCSSDCAVAPGELGEVGLVVSRVTIAARVFDRRQGDAARLPTQGVRVEASVPILTTLKVPVSGSVGKDDPVGIGVDIDFVVDGGFFDGLDWAALLPAGAALDAAVSLDGAEGLGAALEEAMGEATSLQVAVDRFEIDPR